MKATPVVVSRPVESSPSSSPPPPDPTPDKTVTFVCKAGKWEVSLSAKPGLFLTERDFNMLKLMLTAQRPLMRLKAYQAYVASRGSQPSAK